MAHHQHNLRVSNSMDWRKFLESFVEAWRDSDDVEEKKKHEFDLNYTVSQTLGLLELDLESFANSSTSTTSSSSFDLLCNIIPHLAAKCGSGSDLKQQQDVPQLWKDLINSIRLMPPLDPKRPSKPSPAGSKLKELESVKAHGDQQTETQSTVGGHNNGERTLTNSNYSQYNLSSSLSIPNTINASSPNHSIISISLSPQEQVNDTRPHTVTIENMPIIIHSHDQSPPEEIKVGFTVFAVEMVGALSNFSVSSTAKEHYSLIYAVVATSTIAFIISSTALILHKKRPAFAKKMQKAAFVVGAFGFMGILGLHLPVSIMWWFTISTFLVCMLMFAIATYADVMLQAN